jgi:hypothetical protein
VTYEELMGKCVESFVREMKRQRPRGRHRCRYKNKIETDLRSIGYEVGINMSLL